MSSDVVRWTNITSNIYKRSSIRMFSEYIINHKLILLLVLVINISDNVLLVNGDELLNAPGARGYYTPTWAVHILGGNDVADAVATEHGFINLGKIFDDHYHFHHNSIRKRSIDEAHHHQGRLNNDNRVRWSKQQRAKSRQKRDLINKIRPQPVYPTNLHLNDVKWPQMWYLNRGNGLDMNVMPAWREGITGKGVVVTILDDGLESDHPDLEHNYDPKASYDVNSHDDDPMPHYDMTDSNRHGTRCAGEVAATANNSLCAVGIAYGARVGGVRMLDGDVTDAVEARSLSLNPQHIDIYSASWGPDDDGKTVDGPGELATQAFIEGVTKGRNGKGSIFIWASGNGGREHDNCNCDGYTNSIWTLSISSATEEGSVPWYSEMCSSTLATTYSSGGKDEKQVVTTDLHHSCTDSHTGTSASAPLAAGIVALVLEANSNLTWRDLQHIVVRTAKPGNLRDNWGKNGVGRKVSHSFGYGLMDAAEMVKVARTWKTVPEQQLCQVNAPSLDRSIPAKSQIVLQLTVQHCKGVNFLEHVQAKITITSQRRGDLQIYLTSPAGTRVTLLTSRSHDASHSGFMQWPFMSVHTWGETPHGNWLLEIHNEGKFMGRASLKGWSLILYGTSSPADKNDPVNFRYSTVPPPSYSLSPYPQNFSNGYSVATVIKGNMKNNRKQQQQQSNPIVVTSSRKNNGKKNGNGKGKQNNQRTTTVRPNLTTLLINNGSGGGGGNNKEKKPDYNVKSTTLRPKFTQHYQQQHQLQQQNTNDLGNKNEKYQQSLSFMYEKTAIKAPKQVKENAFTTAIIYVDAAMNRPDRWPTANPNIPKPFQKYEKIQQIYPEFHPYTGPKDNVASPVLPVSNGKPSREYSKSIFFSEPDFSGAILPSSSHTQQGYSSTLLSARKKTDAQSQQNKRPATQKTGNAQIRQWDMLFFGTEIPAQPEDPPHFGKPGLSENIYGSEIDHNSLEFEGERASGQWRDTHQVGESHVDVQRTTSNDITNGSCLVFSPDQRCIECMQNTFIYDGRCFKSCPDKTYIIPEMSSFMKKNNNNNNNNIDEDIRENSISDNTVSSLSVRSVYTDNDEYANLDDITHNERAIMKSVPQKLCGECHLTCLQCNGPDDTDCTVCIENYLYTVITSGHGLCIHMKHRTKLDELEYKENLHLFLAAISATTTMISLTIISCWLWNKYKCCFGANESDYVYDKIAMANEDTNFPSVKPMTALTDDDDDEEDFDEEMSE